MQTKRLLFIVALSLAMIAVPAIASALIAQTETGDQEEATDEKKNKKEKKRAKKGARWGAAVGGGLGLLAGAATGDAKLAAAGAAVGAGSAPPPGRSTNTTRASRTIGPR